MPVEQAIKISDLEGDIAMFGRNKEYIRDYADEGSGKPVEFAAFSKVEDLVRRVLGSSNPARLFDEVSGREPRLGWLAGYHMLKDPDLEGEVRDKAAESFVGGFVDVAKDYPEVALGFAKNLIERALVDIDWSVPDVGKAVTIDVVSQNSPAYRTERLGHSAMTTADIDRLYTQIEGMEPTNTIMSPLRVIRATYQRLQNRRLVNEGLTEHLFSKVREEK